MNGLFDNIGIKSIQRGVGSLSMTFKKYGEPQEGETKLEIPLNTVNPAKCLVILNGLAVTDDAKSNSVSGVRAAFANLPYVYNLSKDELVIRDSIGGTLASWADNDAVNGYITYTSRTKVSWQVIEFY